MNERDEQAGDSIGQGQDKTFSFNVTAPSAAGTYSFQWRMIQGSTWFGASTPVGTITVNTTPVGTKFFTVTPCRLLDTRQTGQSPALAIGVERNVQATGGCGVPVGAAAIAGNLTAVSPPDGGFVRIYPAGTFPATATINFNPVRTRANNFIVGLSPTGVASLVGAWGGSLGLHVIVDISGYFAPTGVGVVAEPLEGQAVSPGPEEEALPRDRPAAPSSPVERAGLAETETVLAGTTPHSVSRAAVLAPVETWYLTMRDEANRLSTEYVVNPSSVTRIKQYFYFGNLLAATRDAGSGEFIYYHSDHLGTPRLVTRQDKSVAETHKYRPFGEEIGGSFGNQPLKFAAMEQDQAAGKFYDHARHLGMTGGLTGRFLSPDKVGGRTRDPQTWNRYTYARNNPLSFVDPTGLYFVYAAGLSRRDRSFIRNSLTGVVRRPTGRALFNRLAADPRRIVLGSANLNDPAAIASARFTRNSTLLTFGNTTFLHPVTQTVNMTVDANAIKEFAGRTPSNDRSGVTTAAHELFHVDQALNSSVATFSAGDDPTNATGPAATFGRSVFSENTDISKKEAEAVVDQGLTQAQATQILDSLQAASCFFTHACNPPAK